MLNERKAITKEQIEAYIEKQKINILEDLKKLISFKTLAEEKEEMEKSLQWFLKRAEDMGFSVYKTTAGDVGIVEAGQGEETLGILVHLDVVDIGDPDKWHYPPFEGIISEGSIWGRGTMDDKGAAMICLYAMKALLDFGISFHKKVWLIVGTSEESNWTDMESFKREFPCPDYGFSPDGDFPIYNIENGYADVLLEFAESAYIDQCSFFDVSSGKNTNTIPSKAILSINGKRQVFEGTSAHSSTPELGDNAIIKLCASYSGFNFSRFINEVLACDVHGGKLDFKGELESWEGQRLERTMVAPTVLKCRNDKVLLTINIRQNANIKREDIEKAFDEYRDSYHYDYRITEFLEPMKVSRNLKPFTVMAETYEDWGYRNSFVTATGSSYAKAMENLVSWGPCFPEDLSCAHQENERIGINSLFRAMGIYTDYLCRIISTEECLIT